jgi:hypothetical protein
MPIYMEITSIIKHFFNNDVRKMQKEYKATLGALFKKHGFENEAFNAEKSKLDSVYQQLIGTFFYNRKYKRIKKLAW